MIELLNIEEINVISDWAELNVVYNNSSLSKSKLISLLEDNGYNDDVDYNGDELFDSIIQELEKRKSLYGNNPPFEINNNIISPLINWINYPEYMLCLIFSYWGAANSNGGTTLFERVSNLALKNYLSGDAITIGFPNEGNMPQNLDLISRRLFEDRGSKNPPVHAKDRGIDVIGWNSFEDDRKGQVIVLMQCAAGYNWSLKKTILLDVWAQYINWNYYTTIPSMAITEILSAKKWSNAVETYGIIFDRARIYRCLYKANNVNDINLQTTITEWCNTKLN